MHVLRAALPLCILASVACDPEEPQPPPPTGCVINDQPSFELGTGDTVFEPLLEGADLSMISGPQGGCHFWLSVRTLGFAERRLNIRYDVKYADTGTTTGSRSSLRVRLRPVEGRTDGRCEYVGYTAFLVRPWVFRDREVDLDIDVTDDLGKSASTVRRVTARWPEAVPGIPEDDLCGAR